MTGYWTIDAFIISSIILLAYPLINFFYQENKEKRKDVRTK